MGRDLFAHDRVFRDELTRLDGIVLAKTGESILARVYDDRSPRDKAFDDTRFTHPAIFMMEIALAKKLIFDGVEPDYLLGASLGELTAAALSNAVEVDVALDRVVRQAAIFTERCSPGGMMAIVAPPSLYERTPVLREGVSLAGINYDGHFVVAGSNEALEAVARFLRDQEILFQRISVTRPFHSDLIDSARAESRALFSDLALGRPQIPVVSCTEVAILDRFPADHFWNVAKAPIRFAETIRMMEARGPHLYLELGPSGTLCNFVNKLLPAGSRSQALPLLSPFGQDLKLVENARSAYRSASSPDTIPHSVYGFPGQGSQAKGMGAGLFEAFPDLVAKADAILGYSIAELCLEDRERKLRLTEFTQPALFVTCALGYLAKRRASDAAPAYLLGHSLGEYVALFASGVFDFESGVRLVKKRGELMSQASGGGMAAVIGCDRAAVEEILQANGLDALDIANHNAPLQLVLAGPLEEIARAEAAFVARGARYAKLNVSAPFHSRYMQPAADAFRSFLDGFEFHAPSIPVIANVTALPYGADAEEVRRTLARQIASPVLWADSVRYLLDRGGLAFEEVGPGKVLTKLVGLVTADATAKRAEPAARAEVVEPVLEASVKEERPSPRADAERLGAASFRARYGLRYAYLAGSMGHGIAGRDLVVRLARAGLMGFLGGAGIEPAVLEADVRAASEALGGVGRFGVNLLHDPARPERELEWVELFRRLGITCVEASGFLQITPALVVHRVRGLTLGPDGEPRPVGRVLAKVARPEMAEAFLRPAPERIVQRLVEQGLLGRDEARAAGRLPMADDLCVEAEPGWQSAALGMGALLPSVIRLRDAAAQARGAAARVHVGAAGGIGTPEAAAAAFVMGAEFVLTGSINQCTVEARTSDAVKDMLQQADVQDFEQAPLAQMFELGLRVPVLKKGVFFPARANRLYELWRRHEAFSDIEPSVRQQIEERYLLRSFDEALRGAPVSAEGGPKHAMAHAFRTYFERGVAAALAGDLRHKMDFQIHAGPALGAFNRWVAGTPLETWRERHVDVIGVHLMERTAASLRERLAAFAGMVP